MSHRERLAQLVHSGAFLRGVRIDESVMLETCNRIELYIATSRPGEVATQLTSRALQWLGDVRTYVYAGHPAVVHLFRVASGLDSMVMNEDQIADQVSLASRGARKAGTSRWMLSTLFDVALGVADRAKRPASKRESVSEFALKVALKELGRHPKKILLLGTGEMAKVSAAKLARSRIWVATRRETLPKALKGCAPVSYERARKIMLDCELVVSATKSEGYILDSSGPRFRKKTVIVDLGFPRNVDPGFRALKNVKLIDLDNLASIASRRARKVDRRAERLLEEEAKRFELRLAASQTNSALPRIFRWAELVREEETDAALRKLQKLSPAEKRVVEAMARRIASKLLARPVSFARSSSEELPQEQRLDLLEEIFGGRAG